MRTTSGLAWLMAVLAGLALGILGTSTFAPAPAGSDPREFSAGRAMVDIERIAARPHPTGSREDAEVRAYLKQRFESLGMSVTEQVSPLTPAAAERLAKWSGNPGAPPPAVSLIATLPGRDRSLPAVLLMAHHDTVWGSPGAPDDTTGVAAILETVRALATDGPPARDVIVLITDAEELGLNGAQAFFTSNPLRRHVGAIVNLESRGGGGRATLFETSRSNGNAVRRYFAAAHRPAGSSLSVFVYKLLPNNTDLTEALGGPYAAYNFAFIGRPGLYHSPLATPARLDQGTVQDIGEQVLARTRALAVAEPLPAPAPDLVFFDAFGLVMPHYPGWAGWPMLLVGALGFGLAAWRTPPEDTRW
ncbi:MAG: M20/M25/M40 family metallo-hydrolase, partial [Tsuneonella sp.]